jgi:hypothetical protein
MSPSHTPQQLAAREGPTREMINERLVLTRRERDVLNVIVNWSLARGREWAVFESVDDVAALSGLRRPHTSATILGLEDAKLVHRITRRGEIRLRILSTGDGLVEPTQRVDPLKVAAIAAKLAILNAVPEGYELTGQRLLPLENSDEQLANQHAAMSRDRAAEMTSEAYRIGTPDEIRTETVREDPYRNGTQPTPVTAAGARTRAGHVHVPTSVPQSMLHVHGHEPLAADEDNGALRALSREELWSRLDEEGQYVVSQVLPEVFGVESARQFERTWLLRFCDRWRNDAFRAIGETKRMKVEGARFTKGPGPCANDLFQRFKHSRKAESLT